MFKNWDSWQSVCFTIIICRTQTETFKKHCHINICSKICIPVSTHNETHKKRINTAHKWQWENWSANTNTVKSRNTNSKYRRRDPLKTLCHMGPLHPMLNIRQPETAVTLQTERGQNQTGTKKQNHTGTENRNTGTPETRANGDKNCGNKFWSKRC